MDSKNNNNFFSVISLVFLLLQVASNPVVRAQDYGSPNRTGMSAYGNVYCSSTGNAPGGGVAGVDVKLNCYIDGDTFYTFGHNTTDSTGFFNITLSGSDLEPSDPYTACYVYFDVPTVSGNCPAFYSASNAHIWSFMNSQGFEQTEGYGLVERRKVANWAVDPARSPSASPSQSPLQSPVESPEMSPSPVQAPVMSPEVSPKQSPAPAPAPEERPTEAGMSAYGNVYCSPTWNYPGVGVAKVDVKLNCSSHNNSSVTVGHSTTNYRGFFNITLSSSHLLATIDPHAACYVYFDVPTKRRNCPMFRKAAKARIGSILQAVGYLKTAAYGLVLSEKAVYWRIIESI